jgi:2-dehydropantoate 2-reductase
MRIAIVGVGGVGGYFGGKLAQGGADVVFIARGRTLEALRTKGLRVDSIKGDFTLPTVKVSDDPFSVGPVDAVVMAVKAWQIPEAAAEIRPLIGKETVIVPLENGMEAPEQLAKVLGREHVLGGLCAIVSFIVEPGHVRHMGADPFVMLGELDNSRTRRVERLAEAFRNSGVQTEIPEDIHRSMWTKFLFIAPMSGIGAVTRVPIGAWRSIPETRSMVERALKEVLDVAAARGAKLADDAIEATMKRYDSLPADSTSSLQRDVMDGRPSELDAQLGAVVRLGRESGVATPIHELLYSVLQPMERKARGEV